MHAGEAGTNRCPPGGEATRAALAALLQGDVLPLADDVDAYAAEHVARIDEHACIGCAACLPVCPTDAIIGASKMMHTVIAAECTGCELCILACPVDCIALVAQETAANRVHATLAERAPQSDALRNRYRAHQLRYRERAQAKAAAPGPGPTTEGKKQALLADILARAKARAAEPPRA